MKKFVSLLILSLFAISASAQTIKGDMNGDGKIDVSDVSELVSILIGKKSKEYLLPTVLSPNTYLIVFDGNGSTTGTATKQIVKTDESTVLDSNSFTKEGYYFVGWNTKADGSGTSYTDAETIKNITTDVMIVLYAQWKKDTLIRITYNPISIDNFTYTATSLYTASTDWLEPSLSYTQTKTLTYESGTNDSPSVVGSDSFTVTYTVSEGGSYITTSPDFSTTGKFKWLENTGASERSVKIKVQVTNNDSDGSGEAKTKESEFTASQEKFEETFYVYYGASNTLPGSVEEIVSMSLGNIELAGDKSYSIDIKVDEDTTNTGSKHKYHWITLKLASGYDFSSASGTFGSLTAAIDKDYTLDDYQFYDRYSGRGYITNSFTTFTITKQ